MKTVRPSIRSDASRDGRVRPSPASAAGPHPLAAGNAAVAGALAGGRPLPEGVRGLLERGFGRSLRHVRVHDDGASRQATDSLHARAATTGSNVFLGSAAPRLESPAGTALLAHEVAHVVQQSRATRTTPGVGAAGGRPERAADEAAADVLGGGRATAPAAASTPSVQRDPPQGHAGRAEIVAALTDYFDRARQAQGGRSLRINDQVRTALLRLVQGDFSATFRLETWLNGLTTGIGDASRAFALRVADHLPATLPRERLARLDGAAGTPPPPGTVGRVRELVERTAPARPREDILPPREPTSDERLEQAVEANRIERGLGPTRRFVLPLPITRIADIAAGLPGALAGPPRRRVEGRSHPEVERVAAGLDRRALTPPGRDPDEFADAQEFARGAGRELDRAQQQRHGLVALNLGANYPAASRARVAAEAERIVRLVRDALPHRASQVEEVQILFGTSPGRIIRFSRTAP